MDPSAFDPTSFLDATTTEAATKRAPLPVENPASDDHTYMGVIKEMKPPRMWTGKQDPSKKGFAIDFSVMIDVPAQLQQELKLPAQLPLFDSFMVDTTAQGSIDWSPGKNRRARIYRDATDMNVEGQLFSFRMLEGKVVKIIIAHEMYEGDVMDKIKTVVKA